MSPPPESPTDEDPLSDRDSGIVVIAPKTVMAQQISHDVVDQSQSMGDSSLVDVNANQTISNIAGNGKTTSDAQYPNSNEPLRSQTNAAPADSLRASSAEPLTNGTISHEAPNSDLTEAIASNPVDMSKPAEPDSSTLGDTGEPLGIDETAVQAQAVDASGGSDTDTSKAESIEQRDQSTSGHVRSNSVKKPISFKTVSVTKNFLAKSAVVGHAAKAAGDKTSQGGALNESRQQTPRPRLVAKSGGGLRDSLPKTNKTNGKGPDPAQVWNKNRPTPPPPPKQFTDEELKQQYGIHMATRLQADENSKESKWADIDDDEDDWAPETVEWIDGTKSMLVPTENQPTPADERPPAAVPQDNSQDPSKPADASVQRSGVTGTAKTILKPGGGNQQKAGLVLKGIPEAKPSLVAKPTTATPQKSPWAQLPPVDKVSPVQINPQPPPQPQPPRFQQKSAHGFDAMPPQPSPAREIAADDFDRSWRENERGHRELFDSKSGKYEPVPEGRRGSVRHEQGYRQPAVLQRPSQPGHAAPAEPSPAFQTSRSSTQADGVPWGRRRTSSTVSGGSGQVGRRMSITRPSDYSPAIDDARASPSISGSDNAVAGRPKVNGGQWPNHQSPAIDKAQLSSASVSVTSPADEKVTPGAAPASPIEDMAELQKRVMREKRELARKRREEEEAKLEAEKRERLRQKLEELGPVPDKKRSQDRRQDQPQQQSVARAGETAIVTPSEKSAFTTQSTIASASSIATSPPKPPVPATDGEITQYGSMKLHPPQVYKSTSHPEKSAPKLCPEQPSAQAQLLPSVPQPSPHFQQPSPRTQHLSPHHQQLSPSALLPPGAASSSSSTLSDNNLHRPNSQDFSTRQQLADFDSSRFAQPNTRDRYQVSWNSHQPARSNYSTWLPNNMPSTMPTTLTAVGENWPNQGSNTTQGETWAARDGNAKLRLTSGSSFSPSYGQSAGQPGPGPIAPPNSNAGLTPSQVFEQQPNALHHDHQSATTSATSAAVKQTNSSITPRSLRSQWENEDGEFIEVSAEVYNKWAFFEREQYDGAKKMYEWRKMRHQGRLTGLPSLQEKFVERKSNTLDFKQKTGVVENITHGATRPEAASTEAQTNAAPKATDQSNGAATKPAGDYVPPHMRNVKPRSTPQPTDQANGVVADKPAQDYIPPHKRNVSPRPDSKPLEQLNATTGNKTAQGKLASQIDNVTTKGAPQSIGQSNGIAKTPSQDWVPPHMRNVTPRPDPQPIGQPAATAKPVTQDYGHPHIRYVSNATPKMPVQHVGSSMAAHHGTTRGESPLPETATAPPAFTGEYSFRQAQPKVSMPATPPKPSTEQTFQQTPHQQAIGSGRPSRFFPTVILTETPPPDAMGHPAYDGDVKKPRVSLPKTIVVKLPPTQASQPVPVQQQAPSVQKYTPIPAGAVPLVNTTGWQFRINQLVNPAKIAMTSKPQQVVAPALDPSTKQPLNDSTQHNSVPVSLPGTASITFVIDDDSAATSKISADVLFEDREFGSLPTVKLPKIIITLQIDDSKPMTLLSIYPNSKVNQPRTVDSETTKDFVEFHKGNLDNTESVSFRIKLPGDEKAKPVATSSSAPVNKVEPVNNGPARDTRAGNSNPSYPRRKKTEWARVPRRR
ncbi:MAG: hypothetical protein M1821_000801 [Bathelium mastoideum]|nr:MAG: hypothetical protein M1821_000801 [Bathelium mastoideum]